MPNRIIRDAILSSEKMALLGWPEEVFYRRLMSVVDDYGRYEANPQLLRARCYPLQTDAVRAADISRWMAACQKAGLILCYEVSGKCYLEVLKFQQQQRSASKYPAPQSPDIACNHLLANEHLGVSVSVSEGVVGVGVGVVSVKEPTVLVVAAENPASNDLLGNVVSMPKRIPCPYERIVEVFHDACPSLPRIAALSDKRKKHLSARWAGVDEKAKFTSAEDGLQVFRDVFGKVHASNFLSGRSGAWKAGFDWLIESETNFLKVVEGNYDNDQRAQK